MQEVGDQLLVACPALLRCAAEEGHVADPDHHVAVLLGDVQQVAHDRERQGGDHVDEVHVALLDGPVEELAGPFGDRAGGAAHPALGEERVGGGPQVAVAGRVGEGHHPARADGHVALPRAEQRPGLRAEHGRVAQDVRRLPVGEHRPDRAVVGGVGQVDGRLTAHFGDQGGGVGPGPQAGVGEVDGGGGGGGGGGG